MGTTTILDAALSRPEIGESRFNPEHPRVSSIGTCSRLHVARMLGQAPPPNVHAYYTRLGLTYQNLLAKDFRKRGFRVYEDTEETPLELPTNVKGVMCHPDIWIESPMGSGMPARIGIQVKTVEEEALVKLDAPKKAAVEQARLEWSLWHKSPVIAYDGEKLDCPTHYFIAYVDRQSAGMNRKFFELEFDTDKGRELEKRFLSLEDNRKKGKLPERPFSRKNYECYWNFGVRGEWKCPLLEMCWDE